MSTELATIGPNPFEQYGMIASGRSIEGELLKFSKYGDWLAGKDSTKIDHGTRLVAQMPSLQVGWIKWVDNKPAEARMGFVSEGYMPARRGDLDAQDKSEWPAGTDGKPRDPWQFTNSIVLVNPETEAVYTFQPSSRGGIGAIGELCRAYGKRVRSHPDELPVVALDVSSYKHPVREYGEVREPVLRVVDWVKGEETAAAIAQTNVLDDEQYQPAQPRPASSPAQSRGQNLPKSDPIDDPIPFASEWR